VVANQYHLVDRLNTQTRKGIIMDDTNKTELNLYEVTTGRLQRINKGNLVFAVWRGQTAYKPDVIKCFHVDYDKDGENFLFENLKPLWIEKKNLKHLRSLSSKEITMLDNNNLLQSNKADDIFIYGKFIKESEKAIFVKFANEIDIWIAKSQIINRKVYNLKGREDICFEFPRWMAKEKLGQEVTNKFANAKTIISQNLDTLSTKFNSGGVNA